MQDLDSFSVVKPLIVKALLRLSRDSGLHPRCFALSGFEQVGEQVMAGGGFADILKGLVHGQSVSVKAMRIFEDSDVRAVLKVGYLYTNSNRKISLNEYPGIWSRSCYLAPAVSPKRTSLLRFILSGKQVVSGLPVDGKRSHREISKK